MNNTDKGLAIRILEKEYKIACTPEERDDLKRAIRHLETKIKEISEQGKIIGSERTAIMAAINISYEVMISKNNLSSQTNHQQRLIKLQQDAEQILNKYQPHSG